MTLSCQDTGYGPANPHTCAARRLLKPALWNIYSMQGSARPQEPRTWNLARTFTLKPQLTPRMSPPVMWNPEPWNLHNLTAPRRRPWNLEPGTLDPAS
eukprot:scaffold113624_cov27-Phaeocystis_antarctica.AAC.1